MEKQENYRIKMKIYPCWNFYLFKLNGNKFQTFYSCHTDHKKFQESLIHFQGI